MIAVLEAEAQPPGPAGRLRLRPGQSRRPAARTFCRVVATRLLGNAIWRLTGSDVGEHVHLCERLLRSAAFRDYPDHIVRALKESTARAPELVLHASEAVFARWEGEQRSARLTYTCKDAFALVLRAYTDAFARPDKERALDLLDRGLRSDIYRVAKDLESHDRGWL